MAAPLSAQGLTAPPPIPNQGPQITSISTYVGYYSSGLPNQTGLQPASANLPYDVSLGGSIQLDWKRFTERSSFSLSYTPSCFEDTRHSSVSALNHLASLTISRKLAPRWTFSFSAGINLSSYEQSLFAPTPLSNVASAPATFTDLATGLLAGRFSNNPQLGLLLNSAPVATSPITSLLYGERLFISSASTALSYSFSPRLSMTVAGGGAYTDNLSQNQPSTNRGLLPNSSTANGAVSFSYSLSPRTQIGASLNGTWASSAVLASYTTNSQGTLGRTIRRRWLMQVHGGVAVTSLLGQSGVLLGQPPLASSARPGPVFGGSLAFKTLSQTILGSYDRSTIDAYGLGASTSSSAAATWHWQRHRSSWSLNAAVGWQQLTNHQITAAALSNTTGWQASAALNRALGARTLLSTQYVYLNYSGAIQGTTNHQSQSAVRVAISWTPNLALPR